MPSIYQLNAPPHPFWDFVAGLEDHPIFASRPPHYPAQPNAAPETEQAAQPEKPVDDNEKAEYQKPTVDDEADAPNARGIGENTKEKPEEKAAEGEREMPFRGRGRCGRGARGEGGEEGGCRRGGFGRGHHRGGCHGGPSPGFAAHFGPPNGGPFGGPWWAHRGPPSPTGAGPHPHGHHGPPGPHGPFGPHGHGPHGHGPHGHGPHGHGHHGPCGPRSGSRSPGRRRGPHGGRGGFNLGEFLNNLGNRLGVDLSGAAEGLGVDRFTAENQGETDFTPRADIFDTTEEYIIHLSLPGAKKEDIGVDWDGENSVLRIAGVVHRPGATEDLLKQLSVNGRKREVGVFEKAIQLGTKRDPASIDIAGISAKMSDGILVVKVPKVEVEHQKREVPISGSASPSPVRDAEKMALIDTDELYDETPAPVSAAAKEKEAEHQREMATAEDDRSETMEYEHAEKLPEYAGEGEEHAGSGSEDEGEYVKINVD